MNEDKSSASAAAMCVTCVLTIFVGMYADSDPLIVLSALGLMISIAVLWILEAIHNMRYNTEE